MASMRDIKRRKTSISSTQQITKAMKLVSTVKLQKAKNKAEETTPYFRYMYQTVCSMLAKAGNIDHPYLRESASDQKGIIVITSNRGLAGGYNSNIYTVGRKGQEALARKGYHMESDYSDVMEAPTYEDAQAISKEVLSAYAKGEIGEIYLAYTHFKNTVSHEPTLLRLLPVQVKEEDLAANDADLLMNFEPNEEEALDMIIPKYITSLIYGALVEAVASENGARMQAMDSATSNAEDMINDLSLKYNRARQGSITQELTEIIAGAEAIS